MNENRIIEPTIFTSNKLFIQQLLSYKYFYIVLVILFVASAYLYNKTSSAEYEVYAAIMATKNETSSVLGSNELFTGMQSIQSYNNVEDAINKLRSFAMIYSTIEKLNFEIGYFSEKSGLLKTKNEIYKNAPFIVSLRKSHVQTINAKFYVEILSDSTYRIQSDQSESVLFNYIDNKIFTEKFPVKLDKISRFNEDINLNYLSLSVSKNLDFKPESASKKYKYFFILYNPDLMAKEFLKYLDVNRASGSSSKLNIAFRSKNLDKSIYFINNYLNLFIDESFASKNTVASNTIKFIDAQISGISDSLGRSESKITSFRSANQVMDLSYQGQTAYDNLQRLEIERTDLQLQERYYSYILEYLRTSQDLAGIVPPSGMKVDNPLMNQLIIELLNRNSERSNIISLRGEKNPFLADIENKIKSQRQYIIEIASSNLNTVRQTLSDLEYKSAKLSKDIAAIPRQELNMGNIQRRFNIDAAIYTYLLQKRSEASITMASNYPDFTIFEPAREVTSYQTAPKQMRNYLIALIMALLIPSGIMILKNVINFKISNPEYVHQLINKAPISTIYSVPDKTDNFIFENPASVSSESFRALRSIIFRKLSDTLKSKVILVTSAQPQDGKSFLSYNLAVSIALVGKKTLIIDGDLKRPTLHKKFKIDNKTGISIFMVGNASFDEIVLNTSIDNLSFISAGPTMPNATEVIESGGIDALIEAAKKKFDYIIIDTSPIGFMADAVLMTRYADHILLVVRNKATFKESFSEVITTLESNNISNYDVVFNDKNLSESTYGAYSRYYVKGK
jgi:tyrosine-protein kinase Etk/Wzc